MRRIARLFPLFLLFYIFLPAQAGAEEVFTFGNGDFIHEIIQAVATYCSSGNFGQLLSIMAMLALFAGLMKGLIVQAHGRGDMLFEAFKTFFMVLLIYYICFVPKTNVIIRDELFNTQTEVNNVPWGLAFMTSLTTSIEKSVATAFDTVYTIPNDLKFTQSGYNFGLLALEGTLHQGVTNPYIQTNWTSYIADCVVPAILTGRINEAQLVWENDILGSDVLRTTYANFTTTHYDPNTGQATHPSCKDDYPLIKQEIINHISSEIAPYFANRVAGIGGAASQWVQADVLNRLGAAGDYFLSLAASGQNILQQAVMMNVINEARAPVMAQYATDPTSLQVAQAIANLQARYSLSTGAEMAKTYVPALRRILEGIIYGIFPIILAIAFVPFFRNTLLKSYFYLFFWLIWWSPIFSIINLIVVTRGKGVLSAYNGSFCLGNINPLANGFIDLVGVAGNLLWAVPILSFFIATGSVYAAVAGFRTLGAHVQALSHSAGVSTSPTQPGIGSLTRTGSELTTRQSAESIGITWQDVIGASYRVSPMVVQGAFQRMYGIGTDWRGKIGNYAYSSGLGKGLGMRTGEIAGESRSGELYGIEEAAHTVGTTAKQLSQSISHISSLQGFQRALAIRTQASRLGVSTNNFVSALEAGTYARASEYLNQGMRYLETGDPVKASEYFGKYEGMMQFANSLADKYKLDQLGTENVAALKYGPAAGMWDAYSEARANGYTGKFWQWIALQEKINRESSFASAATMENLARENHFSNAQALLLNNAAYNNARMAAMMAELRDKRLSPENVGALLGTIKAAQAAADAGYVRQAGFKGEYLKELGKNYNEVSKMAIRQALTDIAEKGYVTKDTKGVLKAIAATPEGRAQLAAQGIGDRMIKPEESENFSKWLKGEGINVSSEDLSGATAQMNVWTDRGGNIHMGFLATKHGRTVAEYDLRTSESGTQKTIHGWQGRIEDKGQGVDYFFVSADRIERGNMVTVRGITDEGQEVSLVQNAQTREVISHHAVAGPEGYKGALAMAAAGNEPGEVFVNKVAAIRFAHDYAGEIKGHYNVEISRADLNRFYQGISGALGGGIVASAKATLEKRHGTDWRSISTRDLAQATAYAILTSDKMGVSEKKTRMQLLTDEILNISTIKSEEIPEGKKIFSSAAEPARAINTPVNTITGKPDTHTAALMDEHDILPGKVTDKLPHGGR